MGIEWAVVIWFTWKKLSLLFLYVTVGTKGLGHIMLRDLLIQKKCAQKKVTDFGYPRACRFRKHQIENTYFFSKRDY
jgi:hypothetical protein